MEGNDGSTTLRALGFAHWYVKYLLCFGAVNRGKAKHWTGTGRYNAVARFKVPRRLWSVAVDDVV